MARLTMSDEGGTPTVTSRPGAGTVVALEVAAE
jgi:hypothetical protein